MKFRTDLVTNSSSSSYITITATKTDGTVITDSLESDGIASDYLYCKNDLSRVVNPQTKNGEEILKNIQSMYFNPRIDYLLDDSGEDHPLRSVKDLKELLSIEIKEEIEGELALL